MASIPGFRPETATLMQDDVGPGDLGSEGRRHKEPKDPNKHGQQANTKQNTT